MRKHTRNSANWFQSILLKREKRQLQYDLAKLNFLTERKQEIEKQTNVIWKIINFIPNNHLRAEYDFLLQNKETIESRISEINYKINEF